MRLPPWVKSGCEGVQCDLALTPKAGRLRGGWRVLADMTASPRDVRLPSITDMRQADRLVRFVSISGVGDFLGY
jgi:hypothetical protein